MAISRFYESNKVEENKLPFIFGFVCKAPDLDVGVVRLERLVSMCPIRNPISSSDGSSIIDELR